MSSNNHCLRIVFHYTVHTAHKVFIYLLTYTHLVQKHVHSLTHLVQYNTRCHQSHHFITLLIVLLREQVESVRQTDPSDYISSLND